MAKVEIKHKEIEKNMTNSIKIILLSIGLVLVANVPVFAQDATEAVALDENIQASDLGIGEQSILPDNPLYFLKNWGRGIQSFFTFNPITKSELKEKFANEKLLELKKTIEQNKNAGVIKKAAENYQQEVERVKEQVEKIKETAGENPKVDSFLNKFIHQQILHRKLLQKLEEQVPSEAFEKIKEAREAHMEKFQGVMLKLEDRQEKITEKLDKVLEEQTGSQFKEFKNLEVLKNLEEKVPEQAKEAIQKARKNALKRLQGGLEKMSSGDQEKFKEYTEKISGAKEEQLEILEDLKAGIRKTPSVTGTLQLQKKLEEGTSNILEKIDAAGRQIGCSAWSVIPEFCREGRVIMEKDLTGCFQPRCIIPGEIVCETFITCEVGYEPYNTGERNRQGCPIKKCIKAGTDIIPPAKGITPPSTPPSTGVGRACIEIWAPVCGKDGRTYSNKCFAKLAGVEIAQEGVCKVPPTTGIAPKPGACIQVITPAISPNGICKEFPTPCDVPAGWKKVEKCPLNR
ncbi:MAG: DUF5667 domain-containing protein [bacterium]|nr:DUF5667 domain-containing protein [bacterium]